MQILYEKEITGVKIQAVCGDITEEEVDAIVNAANRYLSHGGPFRGRQKGVGSGRMGNDPLHRKWRQKMEDPVGRG